MPAALSAPEVIKESVSLLPSSVGKGVSIDISGASVTGTVSNISETGSVRFDTGSVSEDSATVPATSAGFSVGSKASRSMSGTSAGSGNGSSS